MPSDYLPIPTGEALLYAGAAIAVGGAAVVVTQAQPTEPTPTDSLPSGAATTDDGVVLNGDGTIQDDVYQGDPGDGSGALPGEDDDLSKGELVDKYSRQIPPDVGSDETLRDSKGLEYDPARYNWVVRNIHGAGDGTLRELITRSEFIEQFSEELPDRPWPDVTRKDSTGAWYNPSQFDWLRANLDTSGFRFPELGPVTGRGD